MDRTLSVRDSRRLACLHSPQNVRITRGCSSKIQHLDLPLNQPVARITILSFFDICTRLSVITLPKVLKAIHNDRQSHHWPTRHEGMNRRLSAVDSPTIFPPETATTRFPGLSEEAA
ncbi:hypothetical protein PAXINDRAFT_22292 [Paxillus involutus ATCC 200175]|uniref:Uncharacterized protein n=1 Tax=Paxillus involutus ATCC 200175 TaxID=664439 RepID=A0A0C9SSA8_PAXIN|nr:hypothetical protein PAXINDRAFT_22292 [Paxillus involutus ATCC 200175]